ncbi:hypothetical protein E2C01_072963 [Portunus trituberculatus]|uniref:Uncharacterized protein n=1 Tax=Portunus trituberculatus TaxID=210409 RepID=A0A5B7I9A6_PORTR|nr:hypothetical protein [Portunus trituberculatus]
MMIHNKWRHERLRNTEEKANNRWMVDYWCQNGQRLAFPQRCCGPLLGYGLREREEPDPKQLC